MGRECVHSVGRRDFLRLSALGAIGLVTTPTRAISDTAPEADPDTSGNSDQITLFMCGDVMTGRGIDQVLPYPSAPRLYERHVRSALDYVKLAERKNGPIAKPVSFPYLWGDALTELTRVRPAVRIINLETSVTESPDPEPKGINYRMHPENVECLTTAGIDCCVLANNHVLDWGRAGLVETLETLRAAGLRTAGAGRDLEEAQAPAILEIDGSGRALVFGLGWKTSGIPRSWAAAADEPGIDRLEDLSNRTVDHIAERVRTWRRPGDVVVASIHWGGNWGYRIPREHRNFARGLVDRAAVDVVHGHSSHHPQGIEVHHGKAVLYGCGDFLNDYEGIGGYEQYRDDLTLMYFPTIDRSSGRLLRLEMIPMQIRNFRLKRPSEEDVGWLRDLFTREGRRLGTRAEREGERALILTWS
jgi:poly-gamma-glutamate synthesis protein (capsule biosynthesis protein)